MGHTLIIRTATALAAVVFAVSALAGNDWIEQKLIAEDGQPSDLFGNRVLVSGDLAVVAAPAPGARPGKVHVLEKVGGFWHRVQTLTATPTLQPPPGWPDFFGWSVALSGDTLLIGAPYSFNPMFGPVGAAYAFTRDDGVWTQQHEFAASDVQPTHQYGGSVALAGDVAVVGAYRDSGGAGAAYIYTLVGGEWTETQKVVPSDPVPGRDLQFGRDLVFDGDTLLVGAAGVDFSSAGTYPQGAVYVFDDPGTGWQEIQKLTADDGEENDQFGFSLAFEDDMLLIGAPYANIDGTVQQGAVYVFERAGGNWSESQKLVLADGEVHDQFGKSIALHGDTALIGEWNRNSNPEQPQPPPKPGAAHLFTHSAGSWSRTRDFVASDAKLNDSVGWHVSMDGDTLLIGATDGRAGSAFEGAAYFYTRLQPGEGVVQGEIGSLGYCGKQPQTLAGVIVDITGSTHAGGVFTTDDGFYQIALAASESPLDLAVAAPGYQTGIFEGVNLDAGDTITLDFDLALDAPCIAEHPAALALTVETGQVVQHELMLDNADGAATLEWSVAAAAPLAADPPSVAGPPPTDAPAAAFAGTAGELEAMDYPRPHRAVALSTWSDSTVGAAHPFDMSGLSGPTVVDCQSHPGLMVHDTGTVDDAYSAGGAEVMFVDRFTPPAYPAPFNVVCVAFVTTQPGTLAFEVVVFADDGPGGGPGTELGALQAMADGIPVVPPLPPKPVWFDVDISTLDITVESGSIYIGVRWAPSTVFIAADQSPANPHGHAGGYWWSDGNGVWLSLADSFAQYRSLFIRAVADPAGCVSAGDVPWLDVQPASGIAPPGESSAVDITVDATGLTPGAYAANLCIASNDPRWPLVVVPVAVLVSPPDALFHDRFE